ncbi:MAG: phenylphosphate carboxylase subunit delta [Gammaproteobacteria bacterium]|nr:MAG: phenylphosphate carboxylase subunit delta [Gammaproteobacteria bacterium]
MTAASEKAKKVKIAVFDVDGVMTDGALYYSSKGDELKAFNVKDGLGIKLLQKHGIKTAIITGRSSELVNRRANELGFDYWYQGREDKITALNELLSDIGMQLEDVGYMGDDLPDLPAIRHAGFGATVADGTQLVLKHADWISNHRGGHGAVREFCEFILDAQGHLAHYHQSCLSK